jgi:hypothetical protein
VDEGADLPAPDDEIFEGNPSEEIADNDERAMKEELRTPLEKVYADEFQRYYDLFVRYVPKKPFHVRTRYGDGFVCQKGRKKNGEEFFRGCYPALIARMLDHDRQRSIVQPEGTPPNYWVAMNCGRKSALKAIDFDNKDNLLGYYRDGSPDDWSPRPLPILTLEHLQAVKRLYDAFPGHIWCISSATIGLHVWEKLSRPLPIETIHAANRPRLREIGLGGTEIHPMFGRCFRRPFGEDYITITDVKLLENWVDQLDYFENVAQPPSSFTAIYRAMRSVFSQEWGRYLNQRTMAKFGSGKPHLRKYFLGNNLVNSRQWQEDLKTLDAWAEKGFPQTFPASEPVVTELRQPKAAEQPKVVLAEVEQTSGCDIDMSAVCNGQWVQTCEMWAKHGLPCHDSVFQVVSQLARWFYFIESWDVPEDVRLEQVVELMTDFCLTKHNGFISSLNAGQERDVRKRIRRIVSCAITKTDDSGKWWFARVRQKRQSGQYRRIIFLEPVIRSNGSEESCQENTKTLPSPLGFICCSDLGNANNPETRRMVAEKWVFEPDDTPLPDELRERIEGVYRQAGKRLFKPTMKKITRFINHLWKKDGEARLGVKALAKMGFPDHNARKHLEMLAHAGIIQKLKGYSPVMGRGIRHRLTKRTMTMFGTVKRKSETA